MTAARRAGRYRGGRRYAGAWLIAAVGLLGGCGGDPAPSAGEGAAGEGGAAGPATYVGSDACAGCHSDAFALWRNSDHDLALQPAGTATVLADFDGTEFADGGAVTRFSRRDDGFYVETADADGAIRTFRVVHAFGVDPLQQYLVETDGGRLQALSIAWDTRPADAGGQRWFHLYADETVTPGDPLHWTGVLQNWNSMCADCHSTGVRKAYDPVSDTYATTFAVEDVGCEACHGPGAAHAARPTDNPLLHGRVERVWTFAAGTPIASRGGQPAPVPEADTCGGCHARRSQLADREPDDAFLDTYRPEWLDRGLYHDDGQIQDEVYEYGSFLQSRMHAAGVTCSDCHEPHSLALRASGDALCARCHAPAVFAAESHHRHPADAPAAGQAGSGGAAIPACVDCHMRAETYMRIDLRRDHSFRVPRPDLSVDTGSPNACNDCHADRSAAWAAARVGQWHGDARAEREHFGRRFAAVREWQSDAVGTLLPLILDRDAASIVRATAIGLLGDGIGGIATPGLQLLAGESDALVRLALIDASAALEPARRIAIVQRFLSDAPTALRLAAADSLAPLREALGPGRRTDLDAGIRDALAAAQYSADRPEGLLLTARLHNANGDAAAARDTLQTVIERFPWFVPAYVNIADLERAAGRDAAALGHVDAGLAVAPDNASLQVSRGLALVRLGRLDDAVAAFRRAGTLAPDDPYNAYLLGLALQSAGQVAAARDTLESAGERFPAYADIWFALATIARDEGDRGRAVEAAQRGRAEVPGDARFTALLAEFGAR